jgi:uncharacterized protein with NRDE domain
MCLVVVAHAAAARYRFVMAANRDELHARPSRPASWWPEPPGLLGGRDLLAGGTWLGVDRHGRVAAVTNVRDGTPREAPRSRGALVTGYLGGTESAADSAARAAAEGASFAAFNLLIFDGAELWYTSNRVSTARLTPGVHAFSNAPFGVEWPKTATAKSGAMRLLAMADPLEPLFELLATRSSAESAEERYHRSHFMTGPVYGTRCSTVILIDDRGILTFAERSFSVEGAPTGEVRETLATLPQSAASTDAQR